MDKICIIGAGPAGLLTASHLLDLQPKIYDTSPFGKLKTHFKQNLINKQYLNKLNSILSQCTFIPKKIESLKELPDCSCFILSIGGQPIKKVGISIDEFLIKKPKSAIFLGCNDTTLDVLDRIDDAIIFARKNLFDCTFSNHILANIKANFNCNLKLELIKHLIKNFSIIFFKQKLRKVFRRYEIVRNNQFLNSKINFYFGVEPKVIDEKVFVGNKVFNKEVIVGSYGYEPKDISKLVRDVDKPYFLVGAVSNPKGNFGSIAVQAKEVAKKVREYLYFKFNKT